ncbi:adenylate/guanylate cyclase domain-containing protein [Gaoshiqia sediminis]|uniref:Adenylate/guanylate cyclase domain-containing protein n=1 Tax=Gaoshiqia sediminis TaxID=2986998 RepID=A0AA42C9B7_9BACT|nr:adenylate/guanylate cyclase domain-containing protein [Gaoshiqia sediminis]MCW0482282.1 adenylate/guanylate cyclase domain-containing protein [Gaoshiqia sediminis]
MMPNRKHTSRKQRKNTGMLFNAEIAGSERLRALILISLLGLEAVLLIIIYFFYRTEYISLFNTHIAIYAILIFTLIMILYESSVHYFIGKEMALFSHHRSAFGYLNSFSEITLLTILFIFIVEYSEQTVILQSPAPLTYFLFIVLSTLRLNFRLSAFSGGLAAVEYVAVSIYYSTVFSDIPVDRFHPDLTGMQYLGQGVILLISGIAAGFVADLIKKKMLTSLASINEKNEVIDLFGQQISPQIADSILEKKDELTGTRKYVCVMFLDIRNFTPFVEKHTPEEVVTYLNNLFSFMIDSVQRYDGVINQFLGDGFMATFGAPVSKGNIPKKAVLAAVEIIERVRQANTAGNIPKTTIGIGLHYGEAVIGNIGSSVRKQYSITGNVVIIASRIEQLNKLWHSQLIISQEVFNEIDANVKSMFVPQKPAKIKGINRPVLLYIFNEEIEISKIRKQ